MKKNLKLIFIIFFIASYLTSNSQTNTTIMNEKQIVNQYINAGLDYDTYSTPKHRVVDIAFIKHASLILNIDNFVIYVDPVAIYGTDFSKLPKADLILVTHEHHDHFDPEAIKEISKDSTQLILSKKVTELLGKGTPILPGETLDIPGAEISIKATPAYNTTPGHTQFHPKERQDVGFVLNIDGMKIYIAGDTEDIPEMAQLKDIDIAFIPVNQPYTMTPQQAVHATEMIMPKILYPYHYGDTDLSSLIRYFEGSPVSVKIRNLQ